MNRFFTYSILAAMMVIAAVGCKKDDIDDRKLSPPAWIHGEWEWAYEDEIRSLSTNFNFTTNDIIFINAISDIPDSPTILTFSEINNKQSNMSAKETVNTNEIYEVTLSSKIMGEPSVYSFKKGDGTYIEYALNSIGNLRLIKK